MFEEYVINEFKGQYNWLSNMTVIQPFIIDGISWNSVENFYQAQKTLNVGRRLQISKLKPHESKTTGKALTLRSDWDEVKDDVMRQALNLKFAQETYLNLLINTGVYELIEGNRWNDTYWGFCLKTNKGQNKLGQMITEIRTEIFENLDKTPMVIDEFVNIKRELDKYMDYKHMDKATIRLLQNTFIGLYSIDSLRVIDDLFESQSYDKVTTEIETQLNQLTSEEDKIHVSLVYKTLVNFIKHFDKYCKSTNLEVSIKYVK